MGVNPLKATDSDSAATQMGRLTLVFLPRRTTPSAYGAPPFLRGNFRKLRIIHSQVHCKKIPGAKNNVSQPGIKQPFSGFSVRPS
jgi:hypothetical protein